MKNSTKKDEFSLAFYDFLPIFVVPWDEEGTFSDEFPPDEGGVGSADREKVHVFEEELDAGQRRAGRLGLVKLGARWRARVREQSQVSVDVTNSHSGPVNNKRCYKYRKKG